MEIIERDEQAGHGARRYRRAVAGSVALALARACSLLSMLVLVPVLLRHLDAARFGLWMTFSSVMASLSLTDLGLGYGLMSAVATSSAAADPTASQRVISSGIAALVGVAVVALVAVVLLGGFAPWSRWLGAPAMPAGELRAAILILLGGMVVGGVCGVGARVEAGMQHGYIASLWTGVASLAALLALVMAAGRGWQLPGLVAILVGVPAAVGLANTLWYFTCHAAALRPARAYVEWSQIRALFRLGLLFFLLQAAAGLAFATDNLMLATVLGADSVPGYAVPAKLFGCISLLVAILVQPLWPAYAEAAARRDFTWIRRAFRHSMMLALGISVTAGAALYLLRRWVFRIWTQTPLPVDDRVVGMLAVWAVIDSCSVALAMLLNGLGIVRFQVAIAIVLVAISFPARYWLLQSLGPWGLPLATAIVYTLVGLIPCMVVIPKLLRQPSS